MTAPAPTRDGVARLVERATDGALTAAELLDSTDSLAALGVGSLSLLRLADSLESEYDVLIDLGDRSLYTDGLDQLTDRVRGLVAQDAP
ncbi:phosphopantetheine-binding protein [Streptomyces sp. NBC_00525]|uniref:phosphopantetheine-binding protein n=1 Tax=Streptomyces sp. NBC_00525 TaxID=2903660 RepID=UPI002E80EC8A|nr:phosphopantetheine-binding protein [Streptomyces sp. NBC_00525]WUC92436.1 hypothetical protein OG710_01910 [Streptomyces sp. NBC_00525]